MILICIRLSNKDEFNVFSQKNNPDLRIYMILFDQDVTLPYLDHQIIHTNEGNYTIRYILHISFGQVIHYLIPFLDQ